MSDPNKFTIHKYVLTGELVQTLEMPQSAQILHVDLQPSGDGLDLCMWAMVLPSQPLKPRRVINVATGEPLPDEVVENFTHIKTIQTFGVRQDEEGNVFPKPIVTHLFLERGAVN
jgi:hypothetical protein